MIKDALDDLIEVKRRECEKLRAQLVTLELELRAFELAAELRPPPHETSARQTQSAEAGSRKGRQPGAISREWRQILRRLAVHYRDGATADDIAAYGPAIGLPNLSARDARQQAKKYVAHGYFESVGDRYKVTNLAREIRGRR